MLDIEYHAETINALMAHRTYVSKCDDRPNKAEELKEIDAMLDRHREDYSNLLPPNMELGEFKPHVNQNDSLGLTEIVLEDCATVSVPWTAGGTLKGHAVDLVYSISTGKLVGVNIWDNVAQIDIISDDH